jgi:hypothetical protein
MVAYKNMTKEQLEAEMDDTDETEVKTSVLREFYNMKLRE